MVDYDLIVRNAKIVTAERQAEGDIAVKDGRIVEIGPDLKAKGTREIDAGGKFVLQTDNPGYWRYMQQIVSLFFEFHEQRGPWPDSPRGRTRRDAPASPADPCPVLCHRPCRHPARYAGWQLFS